MVCSITILKENELNLVCGTADAGIVTKALFVSTKKISMLWCVGKELKLGIQDLDAWSLFNAGTCIFLTTVARELPLALVTKGSVKKLKLI